MRQVIPFSKNIEFKTMIGEITNLSLEHDLALNDEYTVNGNFLVSGKYKINPTATTEEDFSYKIPIDITIDQRYKTDDIELEIDDFKYEVVDSNKLKVDIDLSIDHLEEKEEIKEEEIDCEKDDQLETENIDFSDERKVLTDSEKEEIDAIINDDTTDLFLETGKEEKLEGSLQEEKKETTSVGSLFNSFKDTEETFSTYSVYIVRNGDNVDDIISKYKTTREALEEYNDMANIKIGTKLIIPTVCDEDNK